MIARSVTVLCLLLVVMSSPAENWPELRGPQRNGHTSATALPLTWSETNHVTWKTAIHDLGWSSPLVWDDQIWVTTALENGKQLFAVCVDARTGKVLHDIKVFDTENPEHVAAVNSYASPTGVIEPGRVYVHYGTYGTACLDTKTGEIVWTRRDLRCDHHEGPGSSLMLEHDLLYFNVDGRDVQYVVALEKKTGKTVWKTDRSIDYSSFSTNLRKAFCTPIIIDAAGQRQLVSPGAKAVMAYEPLTGKELWKVRYHGWSMVPRPLFEHGLIYFVNDYERPELCALRPEGLGDVTETAFIWKRTKDVPATPSFLLIGDSLFGVTDQGSVFCLDAKTGDQIWRERLKGKYSASPLYGTGRIYFFSEKNLTTVIEAERTFKVLAENQLEERVMASPAVAGSALILRTKTHLYRIE